MTNMFCWYELVTGDAGAAADFYAKVAGWEMEPSTLPGIDYTIIKNGDRRVGGIMAMEGPPRGWYGYIAVDDVDAYADKVTAAGGAVHKAPADIPNVGRFATCADPQGALFVLFTPMGEPPVEGFPYEMGTQGCWAWNELHTSDWEKGFAFYSGLFGWKKEEAHDMGPMGTYLIYSVGEGAGSKGGAVGGMMTSPLPKPTWLYYIFVDDIDAGKARIEDAGGTIMHGPAEVPGGAWIVQATDPHGTMFAMVGMKAS